MWAVTSADRTNAHGRPTGYRLVPGHGTATLLAQPGSSVDRRAGFARHTLWVTPYDADERFPAGAYPYQHADPGGLPAFSRTVPSRARTSSSGTRSASPTSSAPRTGRSCP